MHLTYEQPPTDAAYIYIVEPAEGVFAAERHGCDVDGRIDLDFDADGRLLGIELAPATFYLRWFPSADGRMGLYLRLAYDSASDVATLHLQPAGVEPIVQTYESEEVPVRVHFGPGSQVVSIEVTTASVRFDASLLAAAGATA